MKFAKDLASNLVQRWEEHYIDYDALKLVLKAAAAAKESGGDAAAAEVAKAAFKDAVAKQLAKVNSFYYAQTAQFREEVENRKLRTRSGSMTADYEVSSTHYSVFRDLADIQSFLWINAEGFRKIMKKYDKLMGFRGTDQQEAIAFEATLTEQPFVSQSELKVCLDILKSEQTVDGRGGGGKMQMKILAGTASVPLAEEISGRIGMGLTPVTCKKFADGEIFIQIQENVREADVYIIQSTCQPVNDHLMELLLTVSALRRASAARVTAVIPYYGYARQDRKDRPRVTISAADVARMIEAMGVDRVISIDLHCGQIQGFFGPRTPADNLYAGPIALQYFKYKNLKKLVVVSPDAGGVTRAKMFRDGLAAVGVEVAFAMIIKQRKEAGVVSSMDLVGSVQGCDCIIVDDMIDTAGTLTKAADEIKAFGANRVFAFATHGLFNGPAAERIEKCCLEEVICSNTIPLKPGTNKVTNKIKQLSVGKLLAETMQRVHNGTSVSELFANPGNLFASAPVKASDRHLAPMPHTGPPASSRPAAAEPEPEA